VVGDGFVCGEEEGGERVVEVEGEESARLRALDHVDGCLLWRCQYEECRAEWRADVEEGVAVIRVDDDEGRASRERGNVRRVEGARIHEGRRSRHRRFGRKLLSLEFQAST